MASLRRRRKADGSWSWDATVRRVGYPTACKSFPTKMEAEYWSARIEAAAAGRTLALTKGMTAAQMLDEVVPRLRNPVACVFAYWREAIGSLRLIDVSPALIAQHRDLLLGAPCAGHGHKHTRPRSTHTVRNYLVELARAYQIAMTELRIVDSNPVALVAKPPASRWRVRFLSDDERIALLAACKASDSPDLYPFVLVALTTGARKGEIAALEWRYVDLKRRWAVFPITKNGTSRGVPLTQAVVSLLEQRPRTNERVFPSDITKAWNTAVARAGITDFRFHDLRHCAGSALTMNGANAVEVATLLGHKTLEMVKRYAHLSNEHTTALVDRVMGGLA
jgi:integrase